LGDEHPYTFSSWRRDTQDSATASGYFPLILMKNMRAGVAFLGFELFCSSSFGFAQRLLSERELCHSARLSFYPLEQAPNMVNSFCVVCHADQSSLSK
jgi:hypothetical protein